MAAESTTTRRPDLIPETQGFEAQRDSVEAASEGQSVRRRIKDIVDRVKAHAKIMTMAAAMSFSLGSCVEAEQASLDLEMSIIYYDGFIAKFTPPGQKIDVIVDPDKGPTFDAEIQEDGKLEADLTPGVTRVDLYFVNTSGDSDSVTLEKEKALSLDF